MSAPVLVLGKDGMMGSALLALLGERGMGLGHGACDFLDVGFLNTLSELYAKRAFSAIINAAAFTQVDDAEEKDSGNLLRVNAVAPGELASWCHRHGVKLVHFSTDYVFDGSGSKPWEENDTPAPLSAYGISKLAGERAVMAAGADSLILRTSWVYDATGKNFFTTMRRLMRERENLQVVDDQIGAPTYAPELADAVLRALFNASGRTDFPSGIYHMCHAGSTSWYGFAHAIYAQELRNTPDLRCKQVTPVPSGGFDTAAKRPLNSRMNCEKLRLALGIQLPRWEDGLAACYAGLAAKPAGQ
jgi:dTDP-4-dehydrorhamnose reductase